MAVYAGVSAPDLQYVSLMMKKTDSDRLHNLCSQIAAEQNHQKFLKLVEELNRLLEAERPPQKPDLRE